MFRKVAAVVAVLGVLLIGPVPAASAVTAGPSTAVNVPDFTPSGSKWREWMLNVTSSILKQATGGKVGVTGSWKSEQIANQHRYTPSAEVLNRMYSNSSYNPNYASNPDSYEDYRMREMTKANKGGVRSLRVQSTLGQKLMKGLNVAGGATLIPLIGSFGTDMVGGWMGYEDTNEEWCRSVAMLDDDDAWAQTFSTAFGLLSMRDCSIFGMGGNYVPNSDLPGGGWDDLVFAGNRISYLGKVGSGSTQYFCYLQRSATTNQLSSLPTTYAFFNEFNNLSMQSTTIGTSGGLGGQSCHDVFPEFNKNTDRYYHSGLWGQQIFFGVGLPDSWYIGNYATGERVASMHEQEEDPERILDCVVTLTDGSVLRSSGQPYTEGSGEFTMPDCPPVPAGKTAEDITIEERTSDGEGGWSAPAEVWSQPTTEEYKQWSTNYPECGEGACKLDLHVKSGSTLGQSCFDIPEGCPGWYEDSNKADKYQCTYGANKVGLEECTIYAGLFKPGRVEVGGAYSDPMTGEWSGGSNSVTLDRQAMGQKVQNPASTRSCNGMAVSGFDPVGFVMRPIQCALEWAFVPRPLVVEAQLAGGGKAWEGKPPAVIAAAVANAAPSASVEGCSRTVTIFSGEFQTSITPLNACPGSWSAPLAAISKIATSAVMAVLVFVVVRRQISGMVGYNQGQ